MSLRHILLASLAALAALSASAQSYPMRPITMVVATAPGGSTDIIARMLAEPLARALGQPIVVDNKAGAAGNIGTEFVARAAPDGYTVLLQYNGFHIGNPLVMPGLRWSPVKDFTPIAMVMRAPHLITVSGKLPVQSIADLVAYGAKKPGGLNYASSGSGSIQHIAGELLARQLKQPMTHIPYKGTGPVMSDLISGNVDMFITTPPPIISHLPSGKLKALAITGSKRNPALPTIPTAAEAGLGSYSVDSWFALLAPANTPPAVVTRLSAEVKAIVESPAFIAKVEDQGAFATYMDAPALGKFIDEELAKYAGIIKAANIKAD